MTNEEAIKQLKKCKSFHNGSYGAAINLAIQALEQQPSEDCISRESVLDVINFEDEWLFDANSHNADTKIAFSTIKSKISEMPSVTPKASEQQPSREWKEIHAESEGSNSWIEFKCPHCGYSFGMESGEYDWHYGDEIPWKYCPICGGSAEHKPYKAESEDCE